MKRMRIVYSLAAVLGLLDMGCATVVTRGGRDQKVAIQADPPGATVVVDGQPTGAAPATVTLARKSEHTVEIAAPGYETAHLTVRRKLNPWLLGNLVLGGPIGLVVDVVTDATHSLSPDELKVNLKPLPLGGTPPSSTPVPTAPQPSTPITRLPAS